MSTLCSCAIRRTSGEDFCRRGSSCSRFGLGALDALASHLGGAAAFPAARPRLQEACSEQCGAGRRVPRRRGRHSSRPPITATTLLTGTFAFLGPMSVERRRPATGSPRRPCRWNLEERPSRSTASPIFLIQRIDRPKGRSFAGSRRSATTVDRDEPLFEISTDKVDAEIPSPAAGVLTDIRAKEGETVPVNSVVAVIGGESVTPRRRAERGRAGTAAEPHSARSRGADSLKRRPRPAGRPRETARARPRPRPRARKTCAGRSPRRSCAGSRRSTTSTSRRSTGTGISGRVTKQDILDYIDGGGAGAGRAGARRRDAAADARRAPRARSDLQARRERQRRADERDAEEDRRAHGAQRAHLAARVLGLRGRTSRGSARFGRSTRRSSRRPARS